MAWNQPRNPVPSGFNPPADIYLATSPDGIHWTSPPGPVLSGAGGWEGDSVGEPYVLLEGGRLRMYYVGEFWRSGTHRIGMATSPP